MTLKKYSSYHKGRLIALTIIFALLAGICAVFAVSAPLTENYTAERYDYTARYDTGSPLYTVADYATDQVACYTDNENVGFYILMSYDDAWDFVVVCGGTDLMDSIAPLQEYTYGNTDQEPERIRVSGTAKPMDPEIMPYVMNEFNYIMGDNSVTEENFSEMFGDYYIDTTAQPGAAGSAVGIILAVFNFAAAIVCLMQVLQRDRQSYRFLSRLSEEEKSRLETEFQRAVLYGKTGLALAGNALLSRQNGLIVVNVNDINNITCYVGGGKGSVVLTMLNGERVALPRTKLSTEVRNELQDLAGKITDIAPQVSYGKDIVMPEQGNVLLSAIPGFYAVDTDRVLALSEQDPYGNQNIDYVSGVLGAIAGAILGSLVWILVFCIGFISGWIGLLMVYLSIKGFKKMAHHLDKKGVWISMIIALLMILPANYIAYTISVYASEPYLGLGYIFLHLFTILQTNEIFVTFITNSLTGAAFMLIFGASYAYSVTKRTTQKAIATAGGSVVFQQESVGKAETDENGRHICRQIENQKRQKAGIKQLYIIAVVFVAIGIITGIATASEGGTALVMIIGMLFPALLFVLLAKWSGSMLQRYIVYDEVSVSLMHPKKKAITIRWDEVTNVKVGNGNYSIQGGGQKIKFTSFYAGSAELVAYAQNRMHVTPYGQS